MTALRLRTPITLRWAAVIPAALLAATAAQVLSMGLAQLTIPFDFLYGSYDWIWAVKSVASVFMGAAFVAAAAWTAPASRRGIAVVAVTAVVAWAFMLAIGGPDVWGMAMGGGGLTGALVVAALVWRTKA